MNNIIKRYGFSFCFLNTSLLWLALCAPNLCNARSLFELNVTIPGESASRGFSDLEDFIDQLNNNGLNNLLTGYVNDVSPTVSRLDIRGVPALATYALNSPVLLFQVPSIGVNVSFTGLNRDQSQDLFVDWLKGAGGAALTQLLKELVAETPVDPIAGNPNSLMSTMANADFSAVGNSISFGSNSENGVPPNLINLGSLYTYSSSGGFKTHSVTLPINYIIPFDEKGSSVIIDAPLNYTNVAGGDAFHGSLGLGIRVPVLRRRGSVDWSLTPFGRVGFSGSKNLGSAAIIYSGSLTSTVNLTFEESDLRVSINNMGGYYTTDSISIGDFEINYDLENGVFKNGIAVEGSLDWILFDDPTTWEFAFVDTQFIGSNLFLNHYDEVNLSFGTRRKTNQMSWESLRLGIGYIFGKNYDAFRFSVNYRF